MGLCLSCLSGNDDDDVNERTSLLANGNQLTNEDYQEELFKQQQRQNELLGIVNDLTDNLIDVSTFVSGNELTPLGDVSVADHEEFAPTTLANATTSPSIRPVSLDKGKVYPRLLDNSEKKRILEALNKAEEPVSVAKASGPLYVTF